MIVNASSLPSERKTANYLLVMSDDIVAGAAKKNRNTIFRLNIKIAVHERELQRNYLLKVAHLSL